MDAKAMVETSRKWISVPPQQSCEVVSPYYYKVIPAMGFVTIELDVNSCPGVRLVTNIFKWLLPVSGRRIKGYTVTFFLVSFEEKPHYSFSML